MTMKRRIRTARIRSNNYNGTYITLGIVGWSFDFALIIDTDNGRTYAMKDGDRLTYPLLKWHQKG